MDELQAWLMIELEEFVARALRLAGKVAIDPPTPLASQTSGAGSCDLEGEELGLRYGP